MKAHKKKLFIVKLDGIGDYIISRNFLSYLTKSKKFSAYDFYLIGNKSYKTLFECVDKESFAKSIWINLDRFQKNRVYRYFLRIYLSRLDGDYLICPTFSRRKYIDEDVVSLIKSKVKVAPIDDLSNKIIEEDSKIYTHLVDSLDTSFFEFLRYKFFFQKVLKPNPIDVQSTAINLPNQVDKSKELTITIALGAGSPNRRWSVNNLCLVFNRLSMYHDFELIIIGGQKDQETASVLISKMKGLPFKLTNYCGKTSFVEVIQLLRKSTFCLANESSIAHLCIAISVPLLCLSNGNHFGRFHPYPKVIAKKAEYIYPDVMMTHSDDENLKRYNKGSDLHVDEIDVNQVLAKLLDFTSYSSRQKSI